MIHRIAFARVRVFLAGALALAGTAAPAEDSTPTYFRDVLPIFKRSCNGCHHPGKLKGELDLTTYEAVVKGGKHGASFKTNDPKNSLLIEEVSGAEPSMPKEGDPLTRDEIALLERWIAQGARDGTPASARSLKPSEPPTYSSAPAISALAFSPDGRWLAVSGYHEVLLHSADGAQIVARLLGESPRIESIAFSPDGRRLAVAGSAPSLFGELQIWDVSTNVTTPTLLKATKVSLDAIYGVSFSPDGERLAVGGADKSVRMFSAADGKELLKFDNHSDWVFATVFTVNGKRLLTGSRDRAMKWIEAANGQFIDDINKLIEPVICFSRHPKEDVIAYGGELGGMRIYKISDNQGRTAANNDVNLIKDFERSPGPVQAIAYSPDGQLLAAGGVGSEVRVYDVKDPKAAKRKFTLKGHSGAIFALAFHPTANQIVTGGFDGQVRLYETEKGELVKTFSPVPLKSPAAQQRAAIAR